MNLDDRLQNVSVIGAAGKMGSGIAVLIAQEMARLKLKPENKSNIYRLNLIDVSEGAIDGLKAYMKAQLTKATEKSIVMIRDLYRERADLVENSDIINAFVDNATAVLNYGVDLKLAEKSKIVFEAIVEDEKTKIKVYKKLSKMCGEDTFFLTNTSSIPIDYLDKNAGLGGRLIGYHFYNPPVVQKLVEVITAQSTVEELRAVGDDLGKRLRKKLVPANDISGFIGNGHFMRDGLYAMSEVDRLKGKFRYAPAIYMMNRVAQDFLVRPMGIFQLIDYVGIDVFQCILKVMRNHLPDETLRSRLIDKMVKAKVLGGQYPDGSQKNGFLKYQKSRPVGVYDIRKKDYVEISDDWKKKNDKRLGPLPEKFVPWRGLLMDSKKDEKLSRHFDQLKSMDTLGAELGLKYLKKSGDIANGLVSQGVANSSEDVNAVLRNGFFWLYGPINEYI